jgi:F-type H+-transporting ATPase subunit delta
MFASAGASDDAHSRAIQVAQDGVSLSGVAGRYASALYELASEKRATDEVAAALAAFQDLLFESSDL